MDGVGRMVVALHERGIVVPQVLTGTATPRPETNEMADSASNDRDAAGRQGMSL